MSLAVERFARLRSLAHPLRLRILSLLTGAPMSAAELSRELEVSQALASYHLRQLAKAGFVEVAERRVRRGALEIRYRSRPEPQVSGVVTGESDLRALPDALALFAEALSSELRRRALDASVAPQLSPLAADADLWVLPEEWARARAVLQEEFRRLHQVARPPRTPGAVRISLTGAVFELKQPGPFQPKGQAPRREG